MTNFGPRAAGLGPQTAGNRCQNAPKSRVPQYLEKPVTSAETGRRRLHRDPAIQGASHGTGMGARRVQEPCNTGYHNVR